MNKSAAFLCALICILLFGCVKTPDNLKSQETKSSAESSESSTPAGEDSNGVKAENPAPDSAEASRAESGDLNVIRAQLESDLQKTYKNIKILNARVGTGEVMPTYDIEIGANEDFTLDKVVELLYSDRVDDVNNPKYWRYTKAGDVDKSMEKYEAHDRPFWVEEEGRVFNKNTASYDVDIFQPDEDKDQSFASFHYSLGNVWGSETGGQFTGDEKYWAESYPSVETYNLDYEKPPEGLSYKMSDGEEWELTQAISYVETFWNDYLAESDPDDFEYAAKSVRVKDFGDDTYGYYFEIQRSDKNGNWHDVNDLNYTYFEDDVKAGKPFIVANNNMTWCAEKEVITRYKKDYSFTLDAVTEPGDNLLSLGKASELLSAALAPNIGLELNAELNYFVFCKGYPYYSIWEYPEYYWDTALTTCDFEIRPFWAFRPAVIPDSNFGAPEIYLVDALNGDVQAMVRGRFEVME